MRRNFIFYFLFSGFSVFFLLSIFHFLFSSPVFAQSVTITASVNGVCGNGTAEWNESCDGTDLKSQTCASRGFSAGTLSCNADCAFNTSACTTSSGGSGGGGGGGGGGSPPPAPSTSATFLGRAYPKSEVTILKDGQIAASTVAGADSQFSIALSGLSGGSYIFSIYTEDNNGNRSSLVTFPVSITAGAATQISGIFISPTIAVDKTQVKRGDNLVIFGQSAPSSLITITIASDNEIFGKIIADSSGAYLYNLDTDELGMGEHLARSKASLVNLNLLSSQSSAISFTVGTVNIFAPKKKAAPKGDSNKDGKVNLIDFSILAFYWTG